MLGGEKASLTRFVYASVLSGDPKRATSHHEDDGSVEGILTANPTNDRS